MTKPKTYAVGYGKPPASGQFKKGKSGNPSGKSKPKTLAAAMRAQLAKEVTTKGSDGLEKKAVAEVVVSKLIMKAIGGDVPSLKLVLHYGLQLAPESEQAPPLSDHEIQQLKDLLLSQT